MTQESFQDFRALKNEFITEQLCSSFFYIYCVHYSLNSCAFLVDIDWEEILLTLFECVKRTKIASSAAPNKRCERFIFASIIIDRWPIKHLINQIKAEIQQGDGKEKGIVQRELLGFAPPPLLRKCIKFLSIGQRIHFI